MHYLLDSRNFPKLFHVNYKFVVLNEGTFAILNKCPHYIIMEEDIKSSTFSLSEREVVAIFIAQRSMTSYDPPINQTQKAVESIS